MFEELNPRDDKFTLQMLEGNLPGGWKPRDQDESPKTEILNRNAIINWGNPANKIAFYDLILISVFALTPRKEQTSR
ncbi:MAG: hypothetical protein CL609_13165 [Anaerolineaceae bacterium]|nr:hypothetical protein [Anaerolineaceae bacterium]